MVLAVRGLPETAGLRGDRRRCGDAQQRVVVPRPGAGSRLDRCGRSDCGIERIHTVSASAMIKSVFSAPRSMIIVVPSIRWS